MKKKLLLMTTLFVAGASYAQFTESNAPVIGDNITLYIVDSTASDMSTIVGDGVTWDYSGLNDYNAEARLVSVKSPQDAGHGVTFVNSDRAIEVEGELITFFSDDAVKRTGNGVVYRDAKNGDLILTLEDTQGIYYTYPFAFEDQESGDIAGTATFTFMNQTINAPATGNFYSKIDGRGTLKLGLTGVYNDVIRYKLVDTINLDTQTPLGTLTVLHTQYEYYDHSISNLPIFTHSKVWFGKVGGLVIRDFTFVLSKDITTSSVSKETLSGSKVYPNPANDFVNIELPNEINSAEITIVDAIGRVVLNTNVENSFSNLNVSHLKEGAYFVKIAAENRVATKTLILQ